MSRGFVNSRERELVSSPEAFNFMALDRLGAGPAFWASHHDHRPARSRCLAALARVALDFANLQNACLHYSGHLLVHLFGIASLNKIGYPAASLQQIFKLVVRDARENRRELDLATIEMTERQ